ncbi:MAG: amidohydrolase family protein, partial [Candidatus Dormiibacterota bacterium]
MIIDAHCHAWRYWPYQPPVPDPEQRGRVEQLLWEMDQVGVDRALLVSAGIDHNPENNQYVADGVAAHPDRLDQVADVDSSWTPTHHTAGAAARLQAIADRWPIKGLTHYVHDTNDGWFRSGEGLAFFEVAAQRGLLVSLSASPAWQDDIREIARRHPSMPILCHHLAGVDPTEGPPFAGLREVLRSAALPNILVKVSGYYYRSHSAWDFPFSDSLRIVRIL